MRFQNRLAVTLLLDSYQTGFRPYKGSGIRSVFDIDIEQTPRRAGHCTSKSGENVEEAVRDSQRN